MTQQDIERLVIEGHKHAVRYDFTLTAVNDGDFKVGLYSDEYELIASGTVSIHTKTDSETVYRLTYSGCAAEPELFSTPRGLFSLLYTTPA